MLLVAGTNYLGINADDFHIISTNNLYCVDYNGPDSMILKIPGNYFTDYQGDILACQAGRGEVGSDISALFIIHWDAVQTNFITRAIPLPDTIPGHFEHVRFAPIDIPRLQ